MKQLTFVFVLIASTLFSQNDQLNPGKQYNPPRPQNTLNINELNIAKKLVLNKGIFKSKALSITSSANAYQIPSALAVRNATQRKDFIVNADTVSAVAGSATVSELLISRDTAFNNRVNLTLPSSPANGQMLNVTFATIVDTFNVVTDTTTALLGWSAVATSIPVGGRYEFFYVTSLNKWVAIRPRNITIP